MALLSPLKKDEPAFTFDRFGKREWTESGNRFILDAAKNNVRMREIAAHLGVSKNSIVGVISRARLRGEYVPTKKANPVIKRVWKKPKRPALNPMDFFREKRISAMKRIAEKLVEKQENVHRIRLKVIDSETAVTLTKLSSGNCKYPMGDPRLSDFRFCGKPQLMSKPYCAEHIALCYRKNGG